MTMTVYKKVTSFLGQGIFWSLVATVGNTFATGLAAIALLILFRFLGPAEAGKFSVLLAASMLVAKTCDFGINAAMVKVMGRFNSAKESEAVITEATELKKRASLAATVIVTLLGGYLWLTQQTLLWEVLAVVVGAVIMLWYEHMVFVAQSRKVVLSTVIINALQAGTKVLVVMTLAVLGSISLVTGTTLFVVAPVVPVLLWRFVLPSPSHNETVGKQSTAKAQPSVLLPIMKHTAFLAVANGILENSDVLFVQHFVNDSNTGLFAGAWRIASMFILIGYSLASVLNPRVSRYHEQRDQRSYVLKALALSGALVASFVLAIPFLPLLIQLTIGPQYVDSLPVLVPLLLAAYLSLATVPLTALFYQLRADWFFSITAVGQLLVLAVGYGVFLPKFGMGAAGLTRLAAHALAFFLALGVVLWTYFSKLRRNYDTTDLKYSKLSNSP